MVTLCPALTEKSLPAYMSWSGVQWLSGAGVVALFLALACALVVLYPAGNPVALNDPASQEAAFKTLLSRKRSWLRAAVVLFAGAMFCFMLMLVISLIILAQ